MLPRVALCIAALTLAAPTAAAQNKPPTPPRAWDETRIVLPMAGRTVAYVPHAPTQHIVLLITGDRGLDAAAARTARRIAELQAIVIAVPLPSVRRAAAREGGCWYVASDL